MHRARIKLLVLFCIATQIPCFASAGGAVDPAETSPPSHRAKKWELAPPQPAYCDESKNILPIQDRAILLAMRHRDAELNVWAARLAQERVSVEAGRQALAAQRAVLERSRQYLEKLQDQQDQKSLARQKALDQIYESMPPRDAAAIFHDLDETIVVTLLRGMDSRHAAKILSVMIPSDAKSATEGLAGMVSKRAPRSSEKRSS